MPTRLPEVSDQEREREQNYNEAGVLIDLSALVAWCIKIEDSDWFIEKFHHPTIGATLALVGWWAIILLRKNVLEKVAKVVLRRQETDEPELITTGAYWLSRNPLYISYLTTLAWLNLWNPHVINYILLLISMVITRKLVDIEEGNLQAVFGEQYDAYRKKVGRWFRNPLKS